MVVKRGILESEDQPAYQRRVAPRTAFTSPVLEEEVGFVMWGQQSYTWASAFFLGKWKQHYRGWMGDLSQLHGEKPKSPSPTWGLAP